MIKINFPLRFLYIIFLLTSFYGWADLSLWNSTNLELADIPTAATFNIGDAGLTTATSDSTQIQGFTDQSCNNLLLTTTVQGSRVFNQNTVAKVSGTSIYAIISQTHPAVNEVHGIKVYPLENFHHVFINDADHCFMVECSVGNSCTGSGVANVNL